MPYGIAKDAGGDSLENVAKTESCVDALMKKGHDKQSAIRICKDQVQKTARRRRRAGS